MRKAMADVVEQGTARRLSGVFRSPDGKPIIVGGKTGSGDNRFGTFNRWGDVITSRATNRTAAFVFYIGDRYFGVITAYVQGKEAENYHFTSALPVAIMRLLAPTLMGRVDKKESETLPSDQLETNPAAQAISFAPARVIRNHAEYLNFEP